LQEGHLIPCSNPPWLAVSHQVKFLLTGRVLSAKNWARVCQGPLEHERMIHRVAASLWHWPSVRITIDESIHEASSPGAWGAVHQAVPDILVRFKGSHLWPSLWIECERNLRTEVHYENRFRKLQAHWPIYVVPDATKKQLLVEKLNRFGLGLGKRRYVHTEVEWQRYIFLMEKKYLKQDLELQVGL
jgi:hypothetical protein